MLVVLGTAVGPPAVSLAGSGGVSTLPSAGTKATAGLRLSVDSRWLDGSGYRPVKVRLSPAGGGVATSNQSVHVVLTPNPWFSQNSKTSAGTRITLTKGSRFSEVVIAVPQKDPWRSINVEVRQHGRIVKELSEIISVPVSYYQWSEAIPSILIIDSDAPAGGATFGATPPTGSRAKAGTRLLPDIRSLAGTFLFENYANYNNANLTVQDFDSSSPADDNQTLRLIGNLAKMAIRPPAALPTRWLDYTSADFVFVSFADLKQLAGLPEQWEAFRRWLSAGGTLCVYGVGDEFQKLADIERLLALGPAAGAEETGIRGWNSPDAKDMDIKIRAGNDSWGTDLRNQGMPGTPAMEAVEAELARRRKTLDSTPFVWRIAESGRVVAMAADDPFPGTAVDWAWLFNSLDSDDWMWYRRHGLSNHRKNHQFWNMMIPGVGSAPVNSFLVLISLFVVLIGPVNYVLLRRYRRLHLLLLLVPLGAGVVTATLFVYAYLDDGLGIRGRARSLTTIDQQNGRVVTWARHAYYAGLVPSRGINYSSDAAVFPIEFDPTGVRHTEWRAQHQVLSRYLRARTMAQLMVVQSRHTNARLQVDVPNDPAAAPRVTNRLGVDIVQMVLTDADGRLYFTGAIPAGDSAWTAAAALDSLSGDWAKVFDDHALQFPVGFDASQMQNAATFLGIRGSSLYNCDANLPEPTTSSSILERGLTRLSRLKQNNMAAKSYVAVVRKAPDLPLGIQTVREEAGFHVVEGKW